MRNIKKISGLAVAMMLAAGCATGPFGMGADDDMGVADDLGFSSWDTDRNGMLDSNEFGIGFDNNEDWFGDWDTDNDGVLSNNEFGIGGSRWGLDNNDFGVWDSSRDGFLDDNEFGTGVFGEWDRDDDGFLTDDEFGMSDDWFG